jgi:peptide/nickel transport system substrate-binding protein
VPPVHDPDVARDLLTAAGWTASGDGWSRPDGGGPARLELLTVADPAHPQPAIVAERVAEAWSAIGLDVTVTELGSATLSARIRTATFDAVVLDLDLGLDPDLYPLLVSHQSVPGGTNIPGYQSSVLDPLLASTRRYGDEATRRRRFSLLQALLVRELPMIPVCFHDHTFLVDEGVSGPRPMDVVSPGDRYGDVLTWSLASGPDE